MTGPRTILETSKMTEQEQMDLMVGKEALDHIDELDNHELGMWTWGTEEPGRTIACVWGSMYLSVHDELADRGPCEKWAEQSPWHDAVSDMFQDPFSDAYTVMYIAKHTNDEGVCDLSGQDLRHLNFSGICTGSVDFRRANLEGVLFDGAFFGHITIDKEGIIHPINYSKLTIKD